MGELREKIKKLKSLYAAVLRSENEKLKTQIKEMIFVQEHDASTKELKTENAQLNSENAVQKSENEHLKKLLNTYRYENKRPLPDKKYSDSPLLRYVFIWMGHVLRMLGKKNGYEKMYQDEIDRLRVEIPEYDGDDDEILLTAYMEESGETEKFYF